MRLSFHHTNPGAGNESLLLRFETHGERACLLIDAGHGTNLDALLQPDDRLVGICLTHAHLDHYSAIAAAHRDDVPIYTSPATAAVLDDVFHVAAAEYDVETTRAIAEAVTPIVDWTAVAPDVEIHPTPAGHVPGAIGFLLRITEGDEKHYLLATGDFTRRNAGGYPGFDANGLPAVDVLFLTAAMNEEFDDTLTEALGTALEHAQRGAPTLVTTSGLVGVQVAYLLASLIEEYELQVPIRVVGQVAKLYVKLEYDQSAVDAVPVFENPRECLSDGTITIAGPEIPRERSSGRLFNVLRDDPNACVIQLIGSGELPITEGQCTIADYRVVNHPTHETLVDVHDALDPTSTVITHCHGGAVGRFNDLDSIVWGSGDTDEYTLYDGRGWLLPPWMGDGPIRQRSHTAEPRRFGHFAGDLLGEPALPSLTRRETPDVTAEGLDVERLENLLTRRPAAVSVSSSTTKATASATDQPATPHSSMPSESDNTADDERPRRSPSSLIRTIGSNVGDDIDPAVEAVLDENDLTEDDLAAAMTARQHEVQNGEAATNEDSQPSGPDSEPSETGSKTPERATESRQATETTDGSTREGDTATERTADLEEATAESNEHIINDRKSGEAPSEDDIDSKPTVIEDEPSPSRPGGSSSKPTTIPEGSVTLTIRPLFVALAERAVEETDEENRRSVGAMLTTATDQYLAALLAGDATGSSEEAFTFDVTGSEATEQVFTALVERDEQAMSTAELACLGLATRLVGEDTAEERVVDVRVSERQLDAVVRSDRFVFETRAAVVEAALLQYFERCCGEVPTGSRHSASSASSSSRTSSTSSGSSNSE